MSNTAIRVDNLSKQYRIGELHEDLFQERFINWLKHGFRRNGAKPVETIFALKDVSFEVREGEILGIIGRNGAGKSTLLSVLSKITYPTSGNVKVNGRLGALLAVGTGFHGDLTGRENIFLNGSILGMKKTEINAKLEEIVSFAGVEKFLDTPVKHYSTGMYLRLGFAVAAHLEPDILLVDEVLAVGDAAFQKKCLNVMNELGGGGRTVLFVSHNMAAIESLCSRALWIENGQLHMDGRPKDVIEAYLATNTDTARLAADFTRIQARRGHGGVKFTKAEFLGSDGEPLKFISSGDALILRLHYEALQQIVSPEFDISIYSTLGILITRFSTAVDYEISLICPGAGWIDLQIDCLNFLPGRYYLSLTLKTQGPILHDDLEHCLEFEVESSDFYGSGKGISRYYGIVFLPRKWRLTTLPHQNKFPLELRYQ